MRLVEKGTIDINRIYSRSQTSAEETQNAGKKEEGEKS